jgi:hypothetical protein
MTGIHRAGAVGLGLAALVVATGVVWSEALLTDDQIRSAIIQQSRSAYYATGHPCACPYDHARNGSACGGRSAYSRPGGASPKCFPQDVTAADIAAFRTTLGRSR